MLQLLSQIFISDPLNLFNIDDQFKFSKLAVTGLIDQSVGLQDQGFFNFNRSSLNNYDCVSIQYTRGKAPSGYLPSSAFKSYNSTSLSGLKRDSFKLASTATCTNTFIINLPRWNSNMKQKTIGIVVFLILAVIFIVFSAMYAMVSINDEAIEEVDDTLLYNCPEMAVCPEAFLNDEAWEAGADDF